MFSIVFAGFPIYPNTFKLGTQTGPDSHHPVKQEPSASFVCLFNTIIFIFIRYFVVKSFSNKIICIGGLFRGLGSGYQGNPLWNNYEFPQLDRITTSCAIDESPTKADPTKVDPIKADPVNLDQAIDVPDSSVQVSYVSWTLSMNRNLIISTEMSWERPGDHRLIYF